MHIAVDAGNSTVVMVLVDGRRIAHRVSLPTESLVGDAGGIAPLLGDEGFAGARGAVISCVVPALLPPLEGALAGAAGGEVVVVGPRLDLGVTLGYARPDELGPDRIADAVAGHAVSGGRAVVVVDFGTATTFNAVTAEGVFLGGAIAAGVITAARAVARRGVRLFDTEAVFPERIIGRNTDECLRSGSLWGAAAMVDGMVEKMLGEMGGGTAIATGGVAPLVAPRCRTLQRWDSDLTLSGLTLLFERNRRR